MSFIRLNCLFLGLNILIFSCNSSKNIITFDKNKVCENFQGRKKEACEILKILSDSAMSQHYITNQHCFTSVINVLANKSQIRPQWFCDYSGCYYFSRSLDKSIFKLDLLRWMRFFKCADTTVLKASTKGVFTKDEINFIKIRENQGGKIDTTIFNSQ